MSVVRRVTALAATLTLAAGAARVAAPPSTAVSGNRSLAKVRSRPTATGSTHNKRDFDSTPPKRCWLCYLRPSRRRRWAS